MAERIVSVKMPASLLDELDRLRERHHYLDLSDQIRSIVRQKCLELTNPYTTEIKRLRKDLGGRSDREQVLQELIRLLREDAR